MAFNQVKLPLRSPNLNSYAERFVRSIKEPCLERIILFGEDTLRIAVRELSLIITESGTIRASAMCSFSLCLSC